MFPELSKEAALQFVVPISIVSIIRLSQAQGIQLMIYMHHSLYMKNILTYHVFFNSV
jgi:hypothetical protein